MNEFVTPSLTRRQRSDVARWVYRLNEYCLNELELFSEICSFHFCPTRNVGNNFNSKASFKMPPPFLRRASTSAIVQWLSIGDRNRSEQMSREKIGLTSANIDVECSFLNVDRWLIDIGPIKDSGMELGCDDQ